MRRLLPCLPMLLIAGFARAQELKPGTKLERKGDEIVVCGQLFHTTAPVVLWTDPGGYDAYRTERRFGPLDEASFDKSKGGDLQSPSRYGSIRRVGLPPEQLEKIRGGGMDLPTLQGIVDQFVIHYDVAGTSRRCFEILQDKRGLSVQFMLDLDGTIYQTLDLKERAWHASQANDRSVGIEIANLGAYPAKDFAKENAWYVKDGEGKVEIKLPEKERKALRHPDMVLSPIRPEPVTGVVQGETLTQYDLTPQQYDSLIKLTATLCTVLPKIKCDYPKDASGKLIPKTLPPAEWKQYAGVLGHYHVQTNKTDPGPAFQWDKVVGGAQGAHESLKSARPRPRDDSSGRLMRGMSYASWYPLAVGLIPGGGISWRSALNHVRMRRLSGRENSWLQAAPGVRGVFGRARGVGAAGMDLLHRPPHAGVPRHDHHEAERGAGVLAVGIGPLVDPGSSRAEPVGDRAVGGDRGDRGLDALRVYRGREPGD